MPILYPLMQLGGSTGPNAHITSNWSYQCSYDSEFAPLLVNKLRPFLSNNPELNYKRTTVHIFIGEDDSGIDL